MVVKFGSSSLRSFKTKFARLFPTTSAAAADAAAADAAAAGRVHLAGQRKLITKEPVLTDIIS